MRREYVRAELYKDGKKTEYYTELALENKDDHKVSIILDSNLPSSFENLWSDCSDWECFVDSFDRNIDELLDMEGVVEYEESDGWNVIFSFLNY